jgi:hypothetical protein
MMFMLFASAFAARIDLCFHILVHLSLLAVLASTAPSYLHFPINQLCMDQGRAYGSVFSYTSPSFYFSCFSQHCTFLIGNAPLSETV